MTPGTPVALRAYPSYKDSGVPWIAEIPESWAVQRLKYSTTTVSTRVINRPEHLRYLGLEHLDSGTGKLNSLPEPAQVDSMVAIFESGDVLFGKLRPYLAKVHLADAAGCSSTEILAFRPKNDLDARFLKYWLLSPGYIETANMLTFGSKMPRVSPEQLANLPIFLPSPAEQKAIAAFLDRETARIDELLLEQDQLLEALSVKRQATITHTVTEGVKIHPQVEANLPWSQTMPSSWTAVRLKNILLEMQQGWSPEGEAREAGEDEWAVLKSGCVNRGTFRPEEHKVISSDLIPRPDLEVKEGDVLMSRASGSLELIGSVAIVEKTRRQLMISDKLFRLRPHPGKVNARFLYYAMNSAHMRLQIRRAVSGAEGLANNIGKGDIGNFFFVCPPLAEQQAITDHLDRVLAQLDLLVSEVRASMELMRQHRSALITAAVTGKIDVRAANSDSPIEAG